MPLLRSSSPLFPHSLEEDSGGYVEFVAAGLKVYKEKHLADPVVIASGGMGYLVKYYNKELLHDVVVKKAKGKDLDARFLKEINTHFRNGSAHLNIVKILGTVVFNDATKGLMLEYLEEGSLDQVIRGTSSPSTNLINQYVYDIGHIISWISVITSAVRFIHSLNVMHLDLKPLNILMHKNRQSIKLADFGLARYASEEISKSEGTVAWMSPEALNKKPVLKSDIYSVAIILWQMIYRSRPYPNEQGIDLLLHVRNKQGRPEITGDCHPKLQDIMKSCWCADLSQRWDSKRLLSVLSQWKSQISSVNNPVTLIQYPELLIPYGTRVSPVGGKTEGRVVNSHGRSYSSNTTTQGTRQHPIASAPPMTSTLTSDYSTQSVSLSDVSRISYTSNIQPKKPLKARSELDEVVLDKSGRKDYPYLKVHRIHSSKDVKNQKFAFCHTATIPRDFLAVGDNTGVTLYDLEGSEIGKNGSFRNKRLVLFKESENCQIEKLVWNSIGTLLATIYKKENKIEVIISVMNPKHSLEYLVVPDEPTTFRLNYSHFISAEFAPNEDDDCLVVVCKEDIRFLIAGDISMNETFLGGNFRIHPSYYVFCGFDCEKNVEVVWKQTMVTVDCAKIQNTKERRNPSLNCALPLCIRYSQIPVSVGQKKLFILEKENSIRIVRFLVDEDAWKWEELKKIDKRKEDETFLYNCGFVERKGESEVYGSCVVVIRNSKISFWYSNERNPKGTIIERGFPIDIGKPIHVEFHPKLAMFAVLSSSSFLVLFAIVDGIIRTYEKYQLPFRTNGKFSWNEDGKKIVVSRGYEGATILVRFRESEEERSPVVRL